MQPAAGDDGGALGAALLVYHQVLGHEDRKPLTDYYLGPEYSDIYIRSVLRKHGDGIVWEELDQETVLHRTATWIHENRVIGWFQGGMEFGPRALGNRSILANPKNPDMKNILNQKVKKR